MQETCFSIPEVLAATAQTLQKALPELTIYSSPTRQHTCLPAAFIICDNTSTECALQGRVWRTLQIKISYILDFHLPNVREQYVHAAEVLDGVLDSIPYAGGKLWTSARHWTIAENVLTYAFTVRVSTTKPVIHQPVRRIDQFIEVKYGTQKAR